MGAGWGEFSQVGIDEFVSPEQEQFYQVMCIFSLARGEKGAYSSQSDQRSRYRLNRIVKLARHVLLGKGVSDCEVGLITTPARTSPVRPQFESKGEIKCSDMAWLERLLWFS